MSNHRQIDEHCRLVQLFERVVLMMKQVPCAPKTTSSLFPNTCSVGNDKTPSIGEGSNDCVKDKDTPIQQQD